MTDSKTNGPPSKGSGCLKCGELGHWARDCKVSNSVQVANRRVVGGPHEQDQHSDIKRKEDSNKLSEAQHENRGSAALAEKNRRKKRKITFELLKTKNGIPDVYHNFKILFQSQFRGKNHETSDLRRLLELYKRWQNRIFPDMQFDHFIASLEKLGSSNIVKKELQDMRVDMLQAVTDFIHPRDIQYDVLQPPLSRQDQELGENENPILNADLPDEDDHLLALISADSRLNNAMDDQFEDEELMELLEERPADSLRQQSVEAKRDDPSNAPGPT